MSQKDTNLVLIHHFKWYNLVWFHWNNIFFSKFNLTIMYIHLYDCQKNVAILFWKSFHFRGNNNLENIKREREGGTFFYSIDTRFFFKLIPANGGQELDKSKTECIWRENKESRVKNEVQTRKRDWKIKSIRFFTGIYVPYSYKQRLCAIFLRTKQALMILSDI